MGRNDIGVSRSILCYEKGIKSLKNDFNHNLQVELLVRLQSETFRIKNFHKKESMVGQLYLNNKVYLVGQISVRFYLTVLLND